MRQLFCVYQIKRDSERKRANIRHCETAGAMASVFRFHATREGEEYIVAAGDFGPRSDSTSAGDSASRFRLLLIWGHR
jgi:hypothetical protein